MTLSALCLAKLLLLLAHYVFSTLSESFMFPQLISLLDCELPKNTGSVLLLIFISLVPTAELVLDKCMWTTLSSLPGF